MNWPTRTTVLFIFSLFTLFSCEESGEIGLDIDETKLGTAFTDTITVKASTILAPDSIVARNRGNLLTGSVTNSSFGLVSAKSFLEVGITSGVGFEDAANARIDSTVLVLDYNEYYGDTTQNLTVNVHKLQQGFRDDVTYFTNSTLPHDAAVIGTATFKPTPRKTVKKVLTNTTVNASIPVRIRMTPAFGAEMLAQSGKTPLSNPTEFLKFLPGIALTSGNDAKSALGFTFSDSTYFKIYYTAGGKKLQYNFIISSTNNRFTQLSADRNNSSLAGLQQTGDSIPAANAGNTAFLQESVGVKTKLTFPYLNKFKQALGTVAINRAELIIPVKSATAFPPSPYLYLFETNKSNRIGRQNGVPIGISANGSSLANFSQPVAATYNSTTQSYTVNITAYLQAVLYNNRINGGRLIQNRGLLVSPASLGQLTSLEALSLQGLNQTLLNLAPGSGVKLRVYYSTNQ
ncbi:DUF4270 family protein [Adhaeribacter rhizoryzae]|uniref:DUF4270 domain-containing protein n=1 Tax=Adhaeribacter rhizoryzae TaxID=2607907 RepID=A0A5M6D7C6_9BACT|nr:DUF4270 family protein [Adhaeribacter rhizoryzae]KAA5542390.1 DUF4270 domain-containing protein [Adhaeribacter rhizoryzae]